MRAALALCALVVMAGCQTGLPKDWTQSNPETWQAVATAAQASVYGPDASKSDPVPMLAFCGRVGALEYAAVLAGGGDDQTAAREAVRTMRAYCETHSPALDYAQLTAAVRSVCGVAANDTDCCLGLMVAGKRSIPK